MKFLFLVQGEGRGHMTQAITLSKILRENGHEVVGAVIGRSERREIPSFFFQKINTKVHTIDSPNFVVGDKNKQVEIFQTIVYNLKRGNRFIKSLKTIHKVVKETSPDVIVNFYELLCGLYYLRYRPKAKHYCIGHQYLIYHPEFVFPNKHYLDKFFLSLNTLITSIGASQKLALSFHDMVDLPHKKLYVMPPLLRQEILEMQPNKGDYIMGYMLNSGYSEDIVKWHENHENVELHFFWDQKDALEETRINNNLTFHKINDVKFIQYLKDCRAFASTAGFESVCEAMYLGKPIMMIPTAGHFEQECNALDAARAGAGIIRKEFDLSGLLQFIDSFQENTWFKTWVKKSKMKFLTRMAS